MSAQAPIREEERPAIRSGKVEGPAETQSPFVETSLGAEEGYPTRRSAVVAAVGATTLMSVGALLGVRFISRRVKRGQRSFRVKDGNLHQLIMVPFTAINAYGKRSRRFTLPRLRLCHLNIRHAGRKPVRRMTRLPLRLRHRLGKC